jgi:hypothetical protein
VNVVRAVAASAVTAILGGFAYLEYDTYKKIHALDELIEEMRVQCEAKNGALVWIVHARGEDAQLECVQYRLAPLTIAIQ